MLSFFRNHQKWFFLVITTIIVISFSFFGSMQQMRESYVEDPVAFNAVNGETVLRSEVEQLANFLATDAADKKEFPEVAQINFLNDGVIQQDFLETGLAPLIVTKYRDFLAPDFLPRQAREQKYKLYHHPKADFISVESIWSIFSPRLNEQFAVLKESSDPLSPESIAARADLYTGTRALPGYMVKQALFRKMQQNSWVQPDPGLRDANVYPFGYQTLEEWFGPKFTRLAAGLIIEVAQLAEEKGLEVSYDEAYASLIEQTYKSYRETRPFQKDHHTSPEQYLQGYLKSVRGDMNQLTNLWRKVLLFRRYFDTYGGAALVDNLPFNAFANEGQEYVAGEKVVLPPAFHLETARDVDLFEAYLSAVAKTGSSLEFPASFRTPEEIAKETPELAYRVYDVNIQKATAADLYAKIPVREMWKWQVEDGNWKTLAAQFPVDLKGTAPTEEARFAILEKLDPKSRRAIDQFSREKMASVDLASVTPLLSASKANMATLKLYEKGGKSPFPAIRDLDALRAKFAKGEDFAYTEDGKTFYRFSDIQQKGPVAIWSFEEAKKEGLLDGLATSRAEQIQNVVTSLQNQLPGGLTLAKEELAKKRSDQWVERLKKDPEFMKQMTREGTPLERQFKLTKTPFRVTRFESKGVVDAAEAFALPVGSWSKVEVAPNGQASLFVVTDKGTEEASQAVLRGAQGAAALIGGEANRHLFEKILAEGDVTPQYFKRNE